MHHHIQPNQKKTCYTFFIVFALTAGFGLIEAIGGYLANSLVLLSDAAHMFSDSLAMAMAALGSWIASKPPSKKHSYGLGRAEIITAWLSSSLLLWIAGSIIWEAIVRLQSHKTLMIQSQLVIFIALLGLIINLIAFKCLSHSQHNHQNLNTRAAILHVIGDLLGSVTAIISGIVIFLTDWWLLDPILSMLIAVLILWSSFQLLKETLHILMEGVPQHIKLASVKKHIEDIPEIKAIHDLHIWTLSSGVVILSAHIQIDNLGQWPLLLNQLTDTLYEKFGIGHTTLQPETKTHALENRPRQ